MSDVQTAAGAHVTFQEVVDGDLPMVINAGYLQTEPDAGWDSTVEDPESAQEVGIVSVPSTSGFNFTPDEQPGTGMDTDSDE